jgi:enoyl-[acyl-carrier-protein] reductase (NADH)
MRKERDRLILQGMGQLSRPELDRQLDERAPEVYNNISPQIEEMVKTRLRTAQFNLGSYFDKDLLDSFKTKSKELENLNSVLHRIGFEEDDYQGKGEFIDAYRANHID